MHFLRIFKVMVKLLLPVMLKWVLKTNFNLLSLDIYQVIFMQ